MNLMFPAQPLSHPASISGEISPRDTAGELAPLPGTWEAMADLISSSCRCSPLSWPVSISQRTCIAPTRLSASARHRVTAIPQGYLKAAAVFKGALITHFRQANHPQKGPVLLLDTPRFRSKRASQVDNLPRRSIIPANRNVQSSILNVFGPSVLGHERLPGLSTPAQSCRNYAFLASGLTDSKPLVFGLILAVSA